MTLSARPLAQRLPESWYARISATVIAAILMVGTLWLFGAEIMRPHLDYVPTASSQLTWQKELAAAETASRWGWPRGDLAVVFAVAKSAWLFGPAGSSAPTGDNIRMTAQNAAASAPYDPRGWLILAALDASSGWTESKTAMALKLSYYTGANDARLSSLRLKLAAKAGEIGDEELRSLIAQEIAMIVSRHPEAIQAVREAYQQGSPSGRRFLSQEVASLDQELSRQLHLQ